MNQKITSSIEKNVNNSFSMELISEFNQENEFKIIRLSDEQTDDEIWVTLPIPIKVKYIIYLSFKKNGDRSREDITQLLNLLSYSVVEMENQWDQITPSVLNYIEIALQLRGTLNFLPELSLFTALTTCNTHDMLVEHRVTADRAKLYALSQTLDRWVDWAKIRTKPLCASEAMLAVLHYYDPDFTLAELMLIYDNQYQIRLDEAILLYKLSHNEKLLSNIILPPLRSEFVDMLKKEEAENEILECMFFDRKTNAKTIFLMVLHLKMRLERVL